jgi:galactose mutarotase-like enzyme
MNILPDTFDASSLQEIQEKQEIETGHVIITHTGNALKEIHMKTTDASLKLSLVKGGTIVSAHLLGEELFDIDPDYQDVEKVTRTKGNPNIFPVFNQMPEGVILDGATYPLPNHGIARNATWKAYVLADLPEVLILQLKSNAETRPYYPYEFTYTQFITLDQSHLTIGQHIDAVGAFGVGFHPYFRVQNKRDLDISGIAPGTRYWYLPNALSKAEKDAVIAHDRSLTYSPGKQGSINFAAGEVNHHFDLENVDKTTITMTDPGLNRRIRIDRSDDYHGLTVWCNEGEENSVCVEPVTDRSGKISAKPMPWTGHVCFTVEKLQ